MELKAQKFVGKNKVKQHLKIKYICKRHLQSTKERYCSNCNIVNYAKV